MSNPINALRVEYLRGALDESNAGQNPIELFHRWMNDAIAENLSEPNAMILATAALDGKPSARVMLLRLADENGFVFFTNYSSRKGKEIAQNPFAALVFFWQPLHRQIRVEGRIARVSAQESDAYFDSRPRGNQLSAAASPQSQVIPNREFLETRVNELDARYPQRVLRPAHWGGYRVVPDVIEFWQGRESRLHDRLRYTRGVNNAWKIERLAP
jgi:pyridoxamine 5'-phosphate oxidase